MAVTFRQKVKRTVEWVFGVEPVGAAGAQRLAGYRDAMLSGRATRSYWGLTGSPELTFSGAAVSPQNFAGTTQMAAQGLSVPVGDEPAMPNARIPQGIPGAVSPQFADYMSYEDS